MALARPSATLPIKETAENTPATASNAARPRIIEKLYWYLRVVISTRASIPPDTSPMNTISAMLMFRYGINGNLQAGRTGAPRRSVPLYHGKGIGGRGSTVWQGLVIL